MPPQPQTDVERLVNQPYSFELDRQNGEASTSGLLHSRLLHGFLTIRVPLPVNLL